MGLSNLFLWQKGRKVKLLAIDTATDACSAALIFESEILVRYELAPRRHTQLILEMCEQLLVEAGVSLQQLDALAFGSRLAHSAAVAT